MKRALLIGAALVMVGAAARRGGKDGRLELVQDDLSGERRSRQLLRVVQVIPGIDPTFGGPPASAVATSLALRGRGVASSLLHTDTRRHVYESGGNADVLRANGVVVHHFPVSGSSGHRGVRWGISPGAAIWLLRNARRYDVLHLHGGWTFTSLIGLLAARLHRKVAVLSTHESLTDFDRAKSQFAKRLTKRVLRRAYFMLFDRVVMSSRLEQVESGDALGAQSVVIPYAVRPIEPRLSRSPRNFRVGFLARIDPKKNLDLIIEALAGLPESIELLVAGDGPDEDVSRLRSLADERGVTNRITWLGFIQGEAKADFLGSIDVLAMPSDYECFCISVIEALSAGVPAIVTARVAVADAVARHQAGVVVEKDSAELGNAIARFARETEFATRASSAAKAAAGEFSLERHGALLEREYWRLVTREEVMPT